MNPDIAQLVEKYSDMVFRFILKIVSDRETALDLTQEIFVKLFENPAYLNNADNIKGYILKTAYNHALNYARNERAHRLKEQDHCSVEQTHTPGPEDEFNKTEQAEIIHCYLNDLSPQQRETVICRFYGEMKLTEIARTLNITETTVRIHLKRALQKLRNLMTAGQEERT
ncbi:MAG: sigma-70 family RNA polymerase sigma factor [Acidobacteria bacterium]|nr:sigma-70 family RNA polymerase sigma factor [Acidobacteriota bacterium]